jgi:probable phosphomutase (TIGR03848 family)
VATVILLRHGRTTSNAEGTLAGQLPVELDETGRAQAGALAGRLADVPLAAVVSSPALRCRQTLALALPAAAPAFDERLTEVGYGDWTGKELKKLARDPLWKIVQAHPSAVTFPNGESMAAMAARGVAAVRDWDAKVPPDGVWLACTHGDMIKAIVADALGVHLDLFQRIMADPASLTVIRYTAGRPFVLRVNDTGGSLAGLVPRKGRRRRAPASDAVVGGGAGAVT